MPVTVPDQSIAAQNGQQQQNPLNTLGGIMGIANNALALKRNTATFNADVAQRQAESQSAQANAQVAQANVKPLIDQQAAITSGAQTNAQSAAFKLHNDYQTTALQTATGLLSDPRINPPLDQNGKPTTQYDPEQATQALIEARKQMIAKGVPETQAEVATAPFVNAIHTPGAVPQMLKNTILGLQGAGQQSATVQPSIVQQSNGQQTTSTNVNPFSPGGAGAAALPTIQQKVPVTGLETQGQDASGNPTVISKDANGHITNISGAPVNGQVTPVRTIPVTETPESIAQLQQRRQQINQAASISGDSFSNNKQIRDLLDQHADDFFAPTGTAATARSALSSKLGFAIGGDSASTYNSIAHNLALQAQARNQAMGVHTDAGSAISEVSSGSPSQDVKTLRRAVNISDAGNSGALMFNNGIESAIKNQGPQAVRDVQNAWSSNYDVNALRLANAQSRGDKQEIQEVISSLGGPKSPAFQQMRKHAANMEMISHGIIPGQ